MDDIIPGLKGDKFPNPKNLIGKANTMQIEMMMP